jgi:hypothetical protein
MKSETKEREESVLAKLKADGIDLETTTEEGIKEALKDTVLPGLCIKIALKIKARLMKKKAGQEAKKKMKYKHVAYDDDFIYVNTPAPYKLNRKDRPDLSDEQLHEEMYSLDQSCKFLYEIVRALGISKKKATALQITLNVMSGEKILSLANNKGCSQKLIRIIQEHIW